jgi:predicted transcriptional regulator
MSLENFNPQAETVRLAGEIVAAYISNNPVPVAELPALIQATHSAIVTLAVALPPQTTSLRSRSSLPAKSVNR